MENIVLPEIVAIGVYNAELAVKNREITKNRKTTMFEIELPTEKGGISHINEETVPITGDLLICAKPGQTRHTRLPFKCYYIHMMISGGALYDILMNAPNYITVDNAEKYLEIFKKLCNYYDTGLERDKIILQSLVLKLIYLIDVSSQKSDRADKIKRNNDNAIKKAIKYIENNLTSDLSLKTISEIASFSPIHFHNCFKASTGMPLREYVEDRRIRKAVNLLIETDLTLAEIAYECGFSSQSYFSYAFKKKMGLTPREYAKEIYNRYDK